MQGHFDWNDLRYLLAVHRSGSFAGAARALRVDQATVGRRLRALERAVGTALLERTPGGAALTEAGRRALRAAECFDAAALELERTVDVGLPEVSGSLRVSATDTLASRIVVPRLGELTARHPSLAVELVTSNQAANLSRQEADLAIRLFRPVEPALAARRAGTLSFGLYASRALLAERGPVRDPAAPEHLLLGYDRALASSSEPLGWVERLRGQIAFRCNSAWTMLAAVRAGLGLGVLPCFLADPEPDLARAVPSLQSREIWLVVHGDLRRSPRARVGLDFFARVLSDAAPLLRGEATEGTKAPPQPCRRGHLRK